MLYLGVACCWPKRDLSPPCGESGALDVPCSGLLDLCPNLDLTDPKGPPGLPDTLIGLLDLPLGLLDLPLGLFDLLLMFVDLPSFGLLDLLEVFTDLSLGLLDLL